MQRTPLSRALERKVRLSRVALYLERLWLRLWLILGLAGLFLALSLAGVWPLMPELAHKAAIGLFGLAALVALFLVARVPWPSRDEGLRRLELSSGVQHRPATSYEDQIALGTDDPVAKRLWEVHRTRLEALFERLKIAGPQPRVDKRDPFALRAVLMLAVVLAYVVVGDRAYDRLVSAFRFGAPPVSIEARLDAWVTPPVYTGIPPIMLADGGKPLGTPAEAGEQKPDVQVPEHSQLIVRASGVRGDRLVVETLVEGASEPTRHDIASTKAKDGKEKKTGVTGTDVLVEARLELRKTQVVRLLDGSRELASWRFRVTPDRAPRITLTKPPETTPRGSLKLSYKVEDDYGVVTAEARFERVDPEVPEEAVKGEPRFPLERPPVLALKLPRANAKAGEATSYHELMSHPWAGTAVRMTLIARDAAGNIGRSEAVELVFPSRRFRKPFARAVIEQRRSLYDDPRNWRRVVRALDALTLAPDLHISDRHVYLGLRSARWRLQYNHLRAGIKSTMEQLWQVALRIEDGNLSEAERRLREAQEKLAKALERGATDEEIKRLMQELREAMAKFMQQLARKGMDDRQVPQGLGPDQMAQPKDLDQMLRNIEELARSGARDAAQQMLSELRDLLERLQSGRMADTGQSREMMRQMSEFGDLIGRQQKLLDDTFGAQRQQRQQGQGRQGQNREGQNRGGQPGQREGQQRGRQGQPGDGESGRPGQPGQQAGPQDGPGLGQRQGNLRGQLDRLMEGMRRFGMQMPRQLDEAGRAMAEAERALKEGNLGKATRDEQRALEQLRKGAQSLAQQMLKMMPSRVGNRGGDRDPLDRPQRHEGPDIGARVQVPDKPDRQRAREILEELRKRLGDMTRPPIELEYLERLLRQF